MIIMISTSLQLQLSLQKQGLPSFRATLIRGARSQSWPTPATPRAGEQLKWRSTTKRSNASSFPTHDTQMGLMWTRAVQMAISMLETYQDLKLRNALMNWLMARRRFASGLWSMYASLIKPDARRLDVGLDSESTVWMNLYTMEMQQLQDVSKKIILYWLAVSSGKSVDKVVRKL